MSGTFSNCFETRGTFSPVDEGDKERETGASFDEKEKMADDKLATLKAMFGDWDGDSLSQILKDSNDDVEVAVDAVLAAGSPVAWSTQRMQQAPTNEEVAVPPAAQPQPAPTTAPNALSVVVPPGTRPGGTLRLTHQGRSFLVDVPAGVSPGQRFMAALPTGPPPTNRRVVELPDDFLRLPPSKAEREMTDQQLAMMLQQEAYLEEDAQQRRRRNLLAQTNASRPASTPAQPQQQGQSVSSMFASVGDSMRAGLNSAAKNIKKLTNRNQEPDQVDYGRVDLQEELLQEESPLHDGSATLDRPPPPTYSEYSGGGGGSSSSHDHTEPPGTISL